MNERAPRPRSFHRNFPSNSQVRLTWCPVQIFRVFFLTCECGQASQCVALRAGYVPRLFECVTLLCAAYSHSVWLCGQRFVWLLTALNRCRVGHQ